MNRYLTALADIIFPPKCLTCDNILDHHDNVPVCPSCFSQARFITSPLCMCCGIPFAGSDVSNHLCGDCLTTKPSFSFARAVCCYEATFLEAIHSFKYKRKTYIGKILGKLMAEYPYASFNIRDFSLVMPVPLHPIRLRERGFNQSVILAREIARRLSIPLDFMTLKRYIYTEPQIHLGKEERLTNVKGVFGVVNKEKILDRNIILIDDVYTTGSTVKECARVLMKSGASSVAVLTFARAV